MPVAVGVGAVVVGAVVLVAPYLSSGGASGGPSGGDSGWNAGSLPPEWRGTWSGEGPGPGPQDGGAPTGRLSTELVLEGSAEDTSVGRQTVRLKDDSDVWCHENLFLEAEHEDFLLLEVGTLSTPYGEESHLCPSVGTLYEVRFDEEDPDLLHITPQGDYRDRGAPEELRHDP